MTSRRAAAAPSKASASSCSRRWGSAGAANTITLPGAPAMSPASPRDARRPTAPSRRGDAAGRAGPVWLVARLLGVDDAVAVEPVEAGVTDTRGGERAGLRVERVHERLLLRARGVRRLL